MITLEEYQARTKAAGMRFRCPSCGSVASTDDFKTYGADPQRAAQECIGRVGTEMGRPGCQYAAFGLIRYEGLIDVAMPDGSVVVAFEPYSEETP